VLLFSNRGIVPKAPTEFVRKIQECIAQLEHVRLNELRSHPAPWSCEKFGLCRHRPLCLRDEVRRRF
jgi:hypothetical protein